MMPQTRMEIMPDISRFRITVIVEMKYAKSAIAIIMKVSVTTDAFKNLKFLKSRAVIKPKNAPIPTETTARIMSCSMIISGVPAVKVVPCRLRIALNIMIDTMSLATPSPKMHE